MKKNENTKEITQMSKFTEANEKIAEKVVEGYKKIEDGVVGGYKKIENGVVEGFGKIEDWFIDRCFKKEGESVEEAKKRMIAEQAARDEKTRAEMQKQYEEQQERIRAGIEGSKSAGKID